MPVIRGTLWRLSSRAAYLYASGFKPRLATYDGWETPVPLRIDIQHGDAAIEQVARDILGLTKLNYNACRLGEGTPVTVGIIQRSGRNLDFKPHDFRPAAELQILHLTSGSGLLWCLNHFGRRRHLAVRGRWLPSKARSCRFLMRWGEPRPQQTLLSIMVRAIVLSKSGSRVVPAPGQERMGVPGLAPRALRATERTANGQCCTKRRGSWGRTCSAISVRATARRSA